MTVSKNPRLLIIDDNKMNQTLLTHSLQGKQYEFLYADDGLTGIACAERENPDLILLDIMMPGMDGFEVCEKLKAEPKTVDIPIIIMSALDKTEDKVKGLDLGAVDYIAKPFQMQEVIARVNAHLTIHQLKSEVQEKHAELEAELEMVSELQCKMLPNPLPQIPGVKIAAHYQTSRYAGGDYYDVVPLPDGKWVIICADASGHSAAAAVLITMLFSLFYANETEAGDPVSMLTYLNRELLRKQDASFITLLYAVYDPATRVLDIVNCGHPFPVVRQAGNSNQSILIEGDHTFPLGIMENDEFPLIRHQLNPGEKMLLYTDGITERFNHGRDMYDTPRLLEAMTSLDADTSPEGDLTSLLQNLEAFADGCPPEDDQTLLLLALD